MSINDDITTAKNGIALVGEIIKAAGENPNVKEAGENLGKTALTITKTINNILLPLAAVNFAFDKAHVYFTEKFQQDMSEKTSQISEDNFVEPKASIAGPALQGLAFTHEEENLKDMYLSLLATAMDKSKAGDAHPAFVEIIKQLSSEEAHLLKGILKSQQAISICEVRMQINGIQGWISLLKHLVNLTNSTTKEPVENAQLPSMIDNWIRLGLVDVDYSTHLEGKSNYAWIDNRPEVVTLRLQHENEKQKIVFQNGILIRTALGFQFSKAVGI